MRETASSVTLAQKSWGANAIALDQARAMP